MPRPWTLALATLLLFTYASIATDTALAQEVEERVGEDRPSPRIILVIDVSSSMSSKISDAVEWAIANVVDVGHEDMEIGIITFNGATVRHTDKLEDGSVREWFRLPAAPVLKRLMKRLRSLGTSGTTDPDDGLRQALRTGAQCLVFISDGEFNYGANPGQVIRQAQEWAKEADRSLPIVSILGVHPDDDDRKTLQELADAAGGQLWVKERPTPPDEEDIPLPAPAPGPKPQTTGPKPQGGPTPGPAR